MYGHQMKKFDWIGYATKKFHEYRGKAHRYARENEDVPMLAFTNAGRASALHELLEAAGHKPDMEDEEAKESEVRDVNRV